jgi:hypothetical protein
VSACGQLRGCFGELERIRIRIDAKKDACGVKQKLGATAQVPGVPSFGVSAHQITGLRPQHCLVCAKVCDAAEVLGGPCVACLYEQRCEHARNPVLFGRLRSDQRRSESLRQVPSLGRGREANSCDSPVEAADEAIPPESACLAPHLRNLGWCRLAQRPMLTSQMIVEKID